MKPLRDTAVYLSGWSRRDVYGVGISLAPDVVMDRLRAGTRDVVMTMATAVGENLKRHGVESVRGEGRLGPDRTVIVRSEEGDELTLRARVILLATGSHPHHPPNVPFDDQDVHDSETVLSIERLPERMMVVGGGPVGPSTPRSSPPSASRSRWSTGERGCCHFWTARCPRPWPRA